MGDKNELRPLREGWTPGEKGMTPTSSRPSPKVPPPKPADAKQSPPPPHRDK